MSLAVITINNPSPAFDKRHQEVQMIHRALHLASVQIRSASGTVASGTITDVGGVTLGTWTYTAVAPS
jgi:hypothetical protein